MHVYIYVLNRSSISPDVFMSVDNYLTMTWYWGTATIYLKRTINCGNRKHL